MTRDEILEALKQIIRIDTKTGGVNSEDSWEIVGPCAKRARRVYDAISAQPAVEPSDEYKPCVIRYDEGGCQ